MMSGYGIVFAHVLFVRHFCDRTFIVTKPHESCVFSVGESLGDAQSGCGP